jgi:hypothetical protein
MDFVVWTTQVEERLVLKEPPFAAASRNVLDEDAVIPLVSVALPGAGTQRGTELDQTELSRCAQRWIRRRPRMGETMRMKVASAMRDAKKLRPRHEKSGTEPVALIT